MKNIYLLSILSIFSLNLYCQIYWEKHPGNPVMLPGAAGEWDNEAIGSGRVIYHDNTYHMWYHGGTIGSLGIGHATSPDGVTWTKDTNNPVLSKGKIGDWDESNVFNPGAVILIDSIFHMWYTGHEGDDLSANIQIGHATSPDLVTWTKDTNNPVLSMGPGGTWDDTWVAGSYVVYDGKEYHMWYSAYNGSHGIRIGHATSPDGVTWTKDPLNPVLTFETGKWDDPRVEISTVIFDGTTYHMWYSGGGYFSWQTGYATSEDGSTWTKYPNNPVLREGPEGSWDDKFVAWCSVMDSAGIKYKMWYCGGETELTGSIGYAESDARLPALWVKSNTLVDATDTVVAEIFKDGIIYIVPEGTSPVNDSITKYKLASVEATANTEVHIPLADFSLGQFTIVAVSNQEFVSPNPFPFQVIPDAKKPVLTLIGAAVQAGDPIRATSSKDAILYLIKTQLPPDLTLIRNPNFLIDSIEATANDTVEFSTSGLNTMTYYLYAVDIYGLFSERGSVDITLGIDEVSKSGIRIYPNPANDLFTVEMDKPGRGSIEITSLNGQLLYSTVMKGTSQRIDLSSFQKGVYFITVRSRNQVWTEKIIKL
jgi:predicted GH43/DUF377 family glycosyl hydrolase